MNSKVKENMKSEKLISLFEEDLCLFHLRSRKKNSILEEMTEHLEKTGKISDKEIIMKMLKNRESLGSTGLGKGVAFPHGKSLAIKELTILFGKSNAGVDFDSLDGKPTRIFFLILAPSNRDAETYLELLSELLKLIKQPDKLKKLHEVEDFESLINFLGGNET
ncbi:MAG TPA: PTS sugar transporter subunit IIA [Candidatus Krumholzibacteriaceae bacterium]|nr:PTS sugar transporter subunit IIA [Candidatus Krumholzibacteriaceae bacterium]